MVWFHRMKIALYFRLITNNYNIIGHNLAQNVRYLLCYQLIKNVSSEHVFYLLLFALYYFCIMLITYFSSESDPAIIGTPHHLCVQYCIYWKNLFSLLPTCVNRVQIWQTASVFFHAPAPVTYVCRCGGITHLLSSSVPLLHGQL